MSQEDATRDKDKPAVPTPEPSPRTAPATEVTEPADAQRFAEAPEPPDDEGDK